MPVTPEEHAFLDAYVYEQSNPPFNGPASQLLAKFGLYVQDVPHLVNAFMKEETEAGHATLPFGHPSLGPPPPCPWQSREEALRRDRERREENEEK